jgi:hypothetical protein
VAFATGFFVAWMCRFAATSMKKAGSQSRRLFQVPDACSASANATPISP